MSLLMKTWPCKAYPYTLPVRYRLSGPKRAGVVIALHGYRHNAKAMLQGIGWLKPGTELPFQVLAVNAPFPVPIRTQAGVFTEAYSWYFRDSRRGFSIVTPEEAAGRVGQLVSELALADRPAVLFGFSMGGYLAPYVAHHLKGLRGIIGLGSGYPADSYANLPPTRVEAIHGEKDEVIPVAGSRAAHAQLMNDGRGFSGAFHAIPGLSHRVDESVEPLVRRLAMEALA